MTLKTFAAGFLLLCVAIGVATLALHRPSSTPSPSLPAAPTGPPKSWPDYSVGGAGFVTPATEDGDLIAHGHDLLTRTFAFIGPEVADAARRFAGNNLACQDCHLNGGTKHSALPLVGIFRTYPKMSVRSGRVITLAERIEECMTRSMNGRELPEDSREMAAFLAYIRFIGEPEAEKAEPEPAAAQPPSAERGAQVYERVCSECHQPDGLGRRRVSSIASLGYEFPPLWGSDSYNDGAGMDKFLRSVGFIQHSMPRGVDAAHPQLTLQDAWDVAAFLQSKPRPHYDGAR